eukprot:396635_1
MFPLQSALLVVSYSLFQYAKCSRQLLANYDGWIQGSTSSPRPSDSCAIGYYQDLIYIIGGKSGSKKLVEFDTTDQTFYDWNSAYIDHETYGYGQFYTQINH